MCGFWSSVCWRQCVRWEQWLCWPRVRGHVGPSIHGSAPPWGTEGWEERRRPSALPLKTGDLNQKVLRNAPKLESPQFLLPPFSSCEDPSPWMEAGEEPHVPELLRSCWGSRVVLQGFELKWMCWGGTRQWHCFVSVALQSVSARGVLWAAQTVLVPVSKIHNLCRIPKYKKKSALSRAIGRREEERWCDNPDKDIR